MQNCKNEVMLTGVLVDDPVPTGSSIGYRFIVAYKTLNYSTYIPIFMLNDIYNRFSREIHSGDKVSIFGRIERAKKGTCLFALDAKLASEKTPQQNEATIEGVTMYNPVYLDWLKHKDNCKLAYTRLKCVSEEHPTSWIDVKAYNDLAENLRNVEKDKKIITNGIITGPLRGGEVLGLRAKKIIR